ncbi:IclR family transcriptional regulator [Streptomyces sp. S3(2020)]|uniref:IclR family transcriptional regulator domain-containing protein n=1 Tax=Streptomyces sp. S3(2020) TaxID=2732044 RepID=UPI0019D12307
MNDVGSGIQSVDRALTILEVLARTGAAGVTEIADELDVNKSTAWRMLATLRQHRLVEQSGDRGKYRLGTGLLRLARATGVGLALLQEARPPCRRLAAETGAPVNVAVLSGSSVFYLDQVPGPTAPHSRNPVGRHLPLHATSDGKVLLSGLEHGRLTEVLGDLSRCAPLTLAEAETLREELSRIRELGFAVTEDEWEDGLTSLAAPVRNARGDVIASMSVFHPTDEHLESVVPLLLDTTAEVSRRLGQDKR